MPPRIKIRRNLYSIFYNNIIWKERIEPHLDGNGGDKAFCMKICRLPQCMNAYICPAGCNKFNFFTRNNLYLFLDYTLDCREVWLNLPARVIRAFVFNKESYVAHISQIFPYQYLRYLHGIECSAFAEVVRHNPHIDAVWYGFILSYPADKDIIPFRGVYRHWILKFLCIIQHF